MKELIENLPKLNLDSARNLKLFDTCFIIELFEKTKNPKIDFDFSMTSFNLEELLHKIHKINPHLKEGIRHFLKNSKKISVLKIDIHPGDWDSERKFVSSINSDLLSKIPDTSDANSEVYTKDRHHLYTAVLKNFLQEYNLKVYKEL